jgi:uncharacterized protein YjiK
MMRPLPRWRLVLRATAFCIPLAALVGVPQATSQTLDRYDISADAGTQKRLPADLGEVSGLATTPDGRLFSHDDERAILYQIHPETGAILKSFSVGLLGTRGDFEGLAIAGERFFLITSRGSLLEFREGDSGASMGYEIHSLGLEAQCELEGLAFHEASGSLLVPCKNPKSDHLDGHLVVFSVPLDSMKPDPIPLVFLPLEAVDASGLGKNFHPSSIEVDPQTGSLILLAAREEAMIELSLQGEIRGSREFKRRNHPQPEGLAFLPDGTMVLADEGQGGRGTITLYHPVSGGEGIQP